MDDETPFQAAMRASDRSVRIGFVAGLITGLIAGLMFAASVSRAEAQGQPCGPAADLGAQLAQRFGEALMWTGTGAGKVPMLIFAQPGGGSWSLVVLRADQACLVASGDAWQPHSPPPLGEEG